MLDSCPIARARKTLEAIGVSTADCYVLTEMGMEKNKQLALDEQAAGSPASGVKPCACS